MATRIEVETTLRDELADQLRTALKAIRAERAGQHAETIMLLRTRKGDFLDGSSPGAERYSTKPFARPAGGLTQRVYDKIQETDDVTYFMTAGDQEWLVFGGGYRQLRRLQGLPTSPVDLRVSGDMLDGMRVRVERTDDGVTIEIGYIEGVSPQEAIQVAEYHNRLGAGKNKVLRKFVGLTGSESDQVIQMLEQDLRRELGL